MNEEYDVVVIGAGLSGQACAHQVRAGGKSVAVVEAGLIGGLTAYWSEIPVPSLLGPTNLLRRLELAAGITSPGATWRRDGRASEERLPYLTDENHAKRLREVGITVIRGRARLESNTEVIVEQEGQERHLSAKNVVIATGSASRIPDIEGLSEAGYWMPREALTFHSLPPSVVVIGDGTHAIELAQLFRMYGAEVTLIARAPHLVMQEDPAVGTLLAQHLYRQGVRIITGRRVVKAERDINSDDRILTLNDDSRIHTRQIVVAAGRRSDVSGLGVERAGIRMGPHGIAVDAHGRAAKNVWAIGDVTGASAAIYMVQYQARIAADDILGRPHPAFLASVPRVAFTDPQVAATGLTLARAREQGHEVVSASVSLPGSPHTPGGRLTLHAERMSGVLLGAWAVSPDAGEWIVLATLAIRASTPIAVLRDALAQLPTYSEVYLRALDHLLSQEGVATFGLAT
jgi:pyruvate/2-oxoglutarate dehydrogenase complex dihydrolipoamide dehydrogenase (E3) component